MNINSRFGNNLTRKILQQVKMYINCHINSITYLDTIVIAKPDKAEDAYDYLKKILSNVFRDKSGIIYTSTIKDCEEVTKGLQTRGVNVKHYHADLPDESKNKTHNQWLENKIQAIVATVAFGMGIDKPDVRFVIHFSVPKSMEALYQESGRAGRDGKNSQCIVMYKLSDYLKNSGYARSKTEIKNATSVLEYCLDLQKCRHYLIGLHFEEMEIKSCKLMCDNCLKKRTINKYDVTSACKDVFQIIKSSSSGDVNLTLTKLVDLWLKPKIKITKPNISKEQAENIIGNLILKNCIREEKSYTPYSVNCYLRNNVFGADVLEIVLNSDNNIDKYLKKVISDEKKRSHDVDCVVIEDNDVGVSSSKKIKSSK